MLNQNDILETQAMIEQQHLDIRTITMGISLLDCCDPDLSACCEKIYNKITRLAKNLVPVGEEIEAEFAGCGYGKFKPAVGEAVVETLRPIREEATRIMKDKAYLEQVYRDGAEKAGYVAEKTLRKVYKKVGFVTR